MKLKQVLFDTISEEWRYGHQGTFLTAHIHKSLADAIEKNGEEVPKELDLSAFNQVKGLPVIQIMVCEQDLLIMYS